MSDSSKSLAYPLIGAAIGLLAGTAVALSQVEYSGTLFLLPTAHMAVGAIAGGIAGFIVREVRD